MSTKQSLEQTQEIEQDEPEQAEGEDSLRTGVKAGMNPSTASSSIKATSVGSATTGGGPGSVTTQSPSSSPSPTAPPFRT